MDEINFMTQERFIEIFSEIDRLNRIPTDSMSIQTPVFRIDNTEFYLFVIQGKIMAYERVPASKSSSYNELRDKGALCLESVEPSDLLHMLHDLGFDSVVDTLLFNLDKF